MPEIITAASPRHLTEPPDFDLVVAWHSWARNGFRRSVDGHYVPRDRYMLFVRYGLREQAEPVVWGDSFDRVALDAYAYRHSSYQFGIWDRDGARWATDDLPPCNCARCRIAAGETIYQTCVQCDEDFALTVNTVGASFCSSECENEYYREEEEREARERGFIHNYSHKPDPNFLRVNDEDDDKLFFGWELELPSDRSRQLGTAIYEGPGRQESVLYSKEDGSIYGVEVVSHPMTHRYFSEQFDHAALFGERVGRYVNGEPSTGYGLHVHVSRSGFKSQAHALRWLLLIYRNERNMQRLARRSSAEWSSFSDIRDCEEKSRRPGVGSRYTAVNAQNGATYEVRVFRSTYTEQELRAAVDFCHASVVYTRDLNAASALKGDGLTWERFSAWVAERPEYANLTREIARTATAPVEPEDDGRTDEYGDPLPAGYPRGACNCSSCIADWVADHSDDDDDDYDDDDDLF